MSTSSSSVASNRGGRRPRAGRPPELKKQLSEAKTLAKQLQTAIRGGLMQLADSYEGLIEIAIQEAVAGDTKVLLRLLELPAKMGINLADADDQVAPTIQIEAAFRVRLNEAAEEGPEAVKELVVVDEYSEGEWVPEEKLHAAP